MLVHAGPSVLPGTQDQLFGDNHHEHQVTSSTGCTISQTFERAHIDYWAGEQIRAFRAYVIYDTEALDAFAA